jgi:transcriptional regulator with XRE-family HTH domain
MNQKQVKEKKPETILSHNLKYLRKSKGISQEELSKQLGIKRSNIAAYESKNVEPRLSVIMDIAKLFDIKLEILIEKKITGDDFEPNNEQDTYLSSMDNLGLDIQNTDSIDAFIDKSIKVRKILQGFKAFYDFKKENYQGENTMNSSMLFDIENFIKLMEHLLNYNETIIKAINNARLKA